MYMDEEDLEDLPQPEITELDITTAIRSKITGLNKNEISEYVQKLICDRIAIELSYEEIYNYIKEFDI